MADVKYLQLNFGFCFSLNKLATSIFPLLEFTEYAFSSPMLLNVHMFVHVVTLEVDGCVAKDNGAHSLRLFD